MFDVADKAGGKSRGEAGPSPGVAQPVGRPSGLQAMLDASPKVLQLQAYGNLLRPRPAPVPPASAIVQKIAWKDVAHKDIRIEGSGAEYQAYHKGEPAGRLELFEDDEGRQWINFVDVDPDLQGLGIGLSLLHHAVAEHGAIYAAAGMERGEETDGDDTRHLSVEGAALVASAVRNHILQADWCFNPAMGDPRQMDEGEPDFGQGGDHGHDEDPAVGSQHGSEEEHDSEEEDPDGPVTNFSYDVEVTLDASRTGGMGYEWSMEVTHVFSGNKRLIEMHGTIEGPEVLTEQFVGACVSQVIRAQCVVRKLEIDEV